MMLTGDGRSHWDNSGKIDTPEVDTSYDEEINMEKLIETFPQKVHRHQSTTLFVWKGCHPLRIGICEWQSISWMNWSIRSLEDAFQTCNWMIKNMFFTFLYIFFSLAIINYHNLIVITYPYTQNIAKMYCEWAYL